MNILQAHNFYQITGGEDIVVAQEKKLLEEKGHQVIPYYRHNDEINGYSRLEQINLLRTTAWSDKTFKDIDLLLQEKEIDICHVHNFLPLISPSIYYACQKNHIPVVQTLHNYRLICTNGVLHRNGATCEDCLGKSSYNSIAKKCYRNSSIQTYAVANMLQKNSKMNTWNTQVDAYFCLTKMAKEKFTQHGVLAEKLIIKPNFVDVPILNTIKKKEDYLFYVGRLTENKGIFLLKELAQKTNYNIKVVGEGELAHELEGINNLQLLGKQLNKETLNLMSNSRALLFPSMLYEGMPMSILEAFALKTPVIASNLGAMASIIKDEKTGLLFSPNSFENFKSKVDFVFNEKTKSQTIINAAFEEYKTKYSKESNYQQIVNAYNEIIKKSKSHVHSSSRN